MAKKRSDPERKIPPWMSGQVLVGEGPLRGMLSHTQFVYNECGCLNKEDWARVDNYGTIYLNPRKKGSPREWEYVISHCLLHLGFDHFQNKSDPVWNRACDFVVAKFLKSNHIGTPPPDFREEPPFPVKSEEQVYTLLKDRPEMSAGLDLGTTSVGKPDMVYTEKPEKAHLYSYHKVDYPALLADSLQSAIRSALDQDKEGGSHRRYTLYNVAKDWFISSYPLLGALAASFRLVDDSETIRSMGISVAAVNPVLQEIYINPRARLSSEEWKFVLAHEYLHAALRHELRCEWRDPVLWNIACDFVINDWLLEMQVGLMPGFVLYDPGFHGMSAESLYDLLEQDSRFYLKRDPGDLIYDDPGDGTWAEDLDRFYRSAIRQGLEYHNHQGRGYLPAALVEEVYALDRPPIRWDVELARWFDQHFTTEEKNRSYARMSRRQSSTPNIPRPAWRREEKEEESHIFGVLLDTSGSMDRHLLAAALGSIASYSVTRDVHHIRLVFCDAATYDQGVVAPEDVAGAVRVQGRGGTRLQPGIDLLDRDPLFPKDAPLLVITDGECDRLYLQGREHAFLIPFGNRLPFPPKGPVFRLK